MKILITESETKGKAYYEADGNTLAEMTFSKAGNRLLIIDHTEVDESLKGKGVGKKLLLKIVEMVRERGIKVLPLCPFAKSVIQKDKSLRDVLQ